jgi:hypothetical protein
MPYLLPGPVYTVIALDDAEAKRLQAIHAGGGALEGVVAGLLVAVIGGPIAMAVAAAIAAHWAINQAQISVAVEKGNGIYIYFLTPLWIAGLWNVAYVEARDPTGVQWSQQSGGEFGTADPADWIEYTIEHGVAAADSVLFRLRMTGATSGWRKILQVPDGEGNTFPIDLNGQYTAGEVSLWANQVRNGQALTFEKAKTWGQMTPVHQLGELQFLQAGDVVEFRWVRD